MPKSGTVHQVDYLAEQYPFFKVFPVKVRIFLTFRLPEAFNFGIREEDCISKMCCSPVLWTYLPPAPPPPNPPPPPKPPPPNPPDPPDPPWLGGVKWRRETNA